MKSLERPRSGLLRRFVAVKQALLLACKRFPEPVGSREEIRYGA